VPMLLNASRDYGAADMDWPRSNRRHRIGRLNVHDAPATGAPRRKGLVIRVALMPRRRMLARPRHTALFTAPMG